jgi:C-terminal processing protease CtpA/Prc
MYEPRLSPVPYEVDEDDVNLKLCTIYKSIKEPLGATIKQNNANNCLSKVAVSRILKGSCIDRSKLLKPGDQILEVNGINTKNSKPEDVLSLLVRLFILKYLLTVV